jgi:hypothetical protein
MIPDPLPIDSCPAAFSTAAGQGFSSCWQLPYAANGRLPSLLSATSPIHLLGTDLRQRLLPALRMSHALAGSAVRSPATITICIIEPEHPIRGSR